MRATRPPDVFLCRKGPDPVRNQGAPSALCLPLPYAALCPPLRAGKWPLQMLQGFRSVFLRPRRRVQASGRRKGAPSANLLPPDRR